MAENADDWSLAAELELAVTRVNEVVGKIYGAGLTTELKVLEGQRIGERAPFPILYCQVWRPITASLQKERTGQ